MEYSWFLYWPSCSCVLFSFLIIGNPAVQSEVRSPRLVSHMPERVRPTAEPPPKSKTGVSELGNSNMLRDKNAHPVNQDSSKLVMADIRNTWRPENTEDQKTTNQSKDGVSSIPAVTSSYSNEDHSTFLNSGQRNTRDLADRPTASNGSAADPSHVSIDDSKLTNSSVYIVDSEVTSPITVLSTEKNETITFFLQNSSTESSLNISNTYTNKTARVVPTVSSSFVKNPKDKENKTKLEVNSKPIKKLTANTKSKPNVSVETSTQELNRTENVTEYSNEIPSSSTNSVPEIIAKNVTVLANYSNGETLNTSESQVSATNRQTMPELQGLQTLSVTLIVVAVIAVICTVTGIGMLSVMFYRRYHWNKPQTFSDKCSNADSTGYIDDSTLKENSEEMYSLDNDSFLNSLEAMTIQNYWADSIRHTKL